MRFLVTGGSGHLGSFLVRRLLQDGREVCVLARPETDLWRIADIRRKIQVVQGALRDMPRAAQAIGRFAPEVVCHLAWQGIVAENRNDPGQLLDNVVGTLELFRIVRDAGCRCFVGLGSQAEYGRQDSPLVETMTERPETAYGVAKLCTGRLLEKACELAGMRFVWLRLLATYGPMEGGSHLIPSLIQTLLARKKPSLTAGEQVWDYLYVGDAAEAIVKAATTESLRGIYNLASGETYTIRHIAETLRDYIDPTLELGFGEVPYRPDQVMRLEADIGRFAGEADWQAKVKMRDGLARTVEWYRPEPRHE